MLGIDTADSGAVVYHPDADGGWPMPSGCQQHAAPAAMRQRVVHEIAQRALGQADVERQGKRVGRDAQQDVSFLRSGPVAGCQALQKDRQIDPGEMRSHRIGFQAQMGQHVREHLIGGGQAVAHGTTMNGDTSGFGGVVFQLVPPKRTVPAWTSSVIYTFGTSGANDGYNPYSGVISGKHGVLLGTTINGGSEAGGGIVFELTPPASGSTWTESELFNPQASQAQEFYAGLTPLAGDTYLTTTYQGGVMGGGEVIEPTLP